MVYDTSSVTSSSFRAYTIANFANFVNFPRMCYYIPFILLDSVQTGAHTDDTVFVIHRCKISHTGADAPKGEYTQYNVVRSHL